MTPKPHSTLWWHAYDHPDHVCNGLCPDAEGEGSPGPDSRDPSCFYCQVLSLEEQYEDVRDKWVTLDAEYDRLKEQLETTHAALRFWVERANRYEDELPPDREYMKARGVLADSYGVGIAAVSNPASRQEG